MKMKDENQIKTKKAQRALKWCRGGNGCFQKVLKYAKHGITNEQRVNIH